MVRHLAGVLLGADPARHGDTRRCAGCRATRRALGECRFAVLLLVALIVGLAISERAGLPAALAQTGPAALMLACCGDRGRLCARPAGSPLAP
jgi:hypothetical protein